MGTRRWTPEQRHRQAEAIKIWKPWEKSTGPKTQTGKSKVSQNAFSGGEIVRVRQLLEQIRQVLRQSNN